MAERRGNGIVVGLVTSLEDPENLGRVKVKYPRFEEQESDWARLVAPMAGKQRGLFLRPEVGDEVLVAFELGDPREIYVLGSVWSQADPPPADDGKAKENNWRFIRSRSGHLIKLDDTKGKEKIEIIDKDGKRQVILDSKEKKVRVVASEGDVEVEAKKGKVKVEATEITIKSTGALKVEAGAVLTLKGKTVNIN